MAREREGGTYWADDEIWARTVSRLQGSGECRSPARSIIFLYSTHTPSHPIQSTQSNHSSLVHRPPGPPVHRSTRVASCAPALRLEHRPTRPTSLLSLSPIVNSMCILSSSPYTVNSLAFPQSTSQPSLPLTSFAPFHLPLFCV